MPWLTAARNVELPLRLAASSAPTGRSGPRSCSTWCGSAVSATSARTSCPAVCDSGWRWPGRWRPPLHGGDGKASSLLLMDEPFSALDAITRDVLQGELLRVWRAAGSAVVFVTHDVREAVRLGQRVVLLSSKPGRVVQQWQVGAEESDVIEEINARLREVISTHAAA